MILKIFDEASRNAKTAICGNNIFQTLALTIGQEELVSCSSDYSTRWLAIK
jgi:hypothetical protein